MTGKIAHNETNSTLKKSLDGKIWVGMTVQQANKSPQLMKIFNFANSINEEDNIITEDELSRYNGPLLVENFDSKKSRLIGKCGYRSMSGMIIEQEEVDFYPGLQIERVNHKGQMRFSQLDINHDGKLSQKEMEIAAKTKEDFNKLIAKIDEIGKDRDWGVIVEGAGSLCGLLLTLTGPIGIAVGIFGAGAAIYGGNKLHSKCNYNKRLKALNLINEFIAQAKNKEYAKAFVEEIASQHVKW